MTSPPATEGSTRSPALPRPRFRGFRLLVSGFWPLATSAAASCGCAHTTALPCHDRAPLRGARLREPRCRAHPRYGPKARQAGLLPQQQQPPRALRSAARQDILSSSLDALRDSAARVAHVTLGRMMRQGRDVRAEKCGVCMPRTQSPCPDSLAARPDTAASHQPSLPSNEPDLRGFNQTGLRNRQPASQGSSGDRKAFFVRKSRCCHVCMMKNFQRPHLPL